MEFEFEKSAEKPAEQPAQLEMSLAAQLLPGPDGLPWVGFVIQYGVTQVVLSMPPDLAERAAPKMSSVLLRGAAEVRRARSGLIVAGPEALKGLILPPNGRSHG